MSELRAPGPCRDCGEHTRAGLVVAEVHQGTAGGASVVICPACEANPARGARLLSIRMRQQRRYPE